MLENCYVTPDTEGQLKRLERAEFQLMMFSYAYTQTDIIDGTR
jgi:hypothetical protein